MQRSQDCIQYDLPYITLSKVQNYSDIHEINGYQYLRQNVWQGEAQ
jgi:hypothetical protein